ncbi:hypothetical protein CWI39_0047p0010 [Hamiltosporidium magnivora]|uniref:Uncharacterized protein n=1 Tax=Hamiltosporidium magnivora TaxID=148818 RepID=A0A4Q9LQN1_9MICR|nr:hypothetical protein CWI39_0047p0010 [Hamiltosporidium magnivora]
MIASCLFYIFDTVFSSNLTSRYSSLPLTLENNVTNHCLNQETSVQNQSYSNNIFGDDSKFTEFKNEATSAGYYDAARDMEHEIISVSSSDNENFTESADNLHRSGRENKNGFLRKNRYRPYATHGRQHDSQRTFSENRDTERSSVSLTPSGSNYIEKQTDLGINTYESGCWNRSPNKHGVISDNETTSETSIKTEVDDRSIPIHSYSDYIENPKESSCKKIPRLSELQVETTNESFEFKLILKKREYLKRNINTKGKSYAMFMDTNEDICFADIQAFISGDFYIDPRASLTDLRPFLEILDSVAEKEEKFWNRPENTRMMNNLKEKMLACISKINFCNDDSPILTFYTGLIHIKHFIRNLICHDINLVKNSCLWILLLKFVHSLSIIPIKNIYMNSRSYVGTSYLKYIDFEAYDGNTHVNYLIKKQYEIFDAIARHVFLKTKIFPESIFMLDYIKNSLWFCNKDIHVALGKYIGLCRVITDCILRLDPRVICMYILRISEQKSIDWNSINFRPSISAFLINLFSGSINNGDNNLIRDFKIIYKAIILGYVDFFRQEALQQEFQSSKNASFLKILDFEIRKFLKKLEIKRLLFGCTAVKHLENICEAFCVLFNYYIKIGLNNQAYSERYMKRSLVICEKKIIFLNIKLDS